MSLSRSLAPVLLLPAMLAAEAAVAAPPSPSERLDALIERVEEAQRSTESMRARFRQERSSPMLLEPTVATGTFRYLAPGRVRWDYDEPEEMVVVFDDRTLTTWLVEDRAAETVEVKRRSAALLRFLSGTESLGDLASRFRVALADPGGDEPYVLTLDPLRALLQRKIERVVLEIDRELALPVAFSYTTPGGERTSWRLLDLERDVAVDPDAFCLELPEGTTVREVDASSAVF